MMASGDARFAAIKKMRVMAVKSRARTEVEVERMWAVPATNFVVKAEVAMVFPP